MDEPFGAVDPITRQRLQDALIHIQEEVQKTMVIVTHDFDEAVKLGDWIVVFNEGARIVQYDTPARILAEPANEFVENFIGSGAGLKQPTLRRVGDVDLAPAITGRPGEPAADVLARINEAGHNHAVIVDERNRPIQWLSRLQLTRLTTIASIRDENIPVIGRRATLNDALDTMLVSSVGAALVTGRRDMFLGVINIETIMDAITAVRADAASAASADTPVGTNTEAISIIDIDPNGVAA